MPSTRAPRARSSAVAQAQKANKSSQTVWIVVGVIIVIGLAAVLAVALAQEDSSSTAGPQVAEVTVTGSLPPLPPTGQSQAVGLDAPEVEGTSFDGSTVSITNDGTPRVIGFFTHWCPACREEVPLVSSWYNDGGAPDDVEIMAVSTGVNPQGVNYPPSRWFEREDWNVPTMRDDATSSVGTAFGLSAYPYWVAIDGDGKVVDQLTGILSVDEIEGLIERARQGAN